MKYAKVMPQGLTHTYFIANIFMLMIQEKYKTFFLGEMLFYVDDSVIFTNSSEDDIFEEPFIKSVKSFNKEIYESEQELLYKKIEENSVLHKDYCYNTNDYDVQVHDAETENLKSIFSPVTDAKKYSEELYLRSFSRETSNMGFDISTTFSDAEVHMISNKTNTTLDAINREINLISQDDLTKKVYFEKLY